MSSAISSILKQKTAADSVDESRRWDYLNRQVPMEYLGSEGRIRFIGASYERVCGYFWPAKDPKAVVVLVHGQGSYLIFDYLKPHGAGKFKTYEGSWVQALNKAGFSVAGLDNRGCGRSSGLFGYVNHHRCWVNDLLRFTSHVQHTNIPGFAGLPTFLLGSSLGGCIALHAAITKPAAYQGLMLLAPMISLEKLKRKGLNPILLKVAAVLNWFVPTWPLVHTNKNDLFPELQADFDTDLCTYHYNTRVRVGVECLRACDSLLANMHKLDVPFMVVHSVKDDMTDPDGSRLLVQQAKVQDKTLKLVDNFWHVLTKEPGNDRVLADCIAWANSRLADKLSKSSSGTGLAADSWEKVEMHEVADAGVLLN